jgi:hypothetical protein
LLAFKTSSTLTAFSKLEKDCRPIHERRDAYRVSIGLAPIAKPSGPNAESGPGWAERGIAKVTDKETRLGIAVILTMYDAQCKPDFLTSTQKQALWQAAMAESSEQEKSENIGRETMFRNHLGFYKWCDYSRPAARTFTERFR